MMQRWAVLVFWVVSGAGCASLLGDDFAFDEPTGQGGASGEGGAGGAPGDPGVLRIANMLSDRKDLSVCVRPHGSGEVFLDATLAFYGLPGGILPPGQMTGFQRIKTPHLDIGLSNSKNCTTPTVEFDVVLTTHPFQTLVLAGALAPETGEKGAAEGWQILKDRPTPPVSGEFFGRGIHAVADGPDMEMVSWLEGTLDSKTFRELSFRKQPVSPARADPFYNIDDLGYAKTSISIDALSLYEFLIPAYSRRIGLFAPTQQQRDRLKEPPDGSAPPPLALFAWGKFTKSVVDGQETFSGVSATACFEDYQIRKGLTDCSEVELSTLIPLAPLRLGNMTAQPVRACVKPTTYKSWKIVPNNGYLIQPFQFLRDLPTPPDIYETAFIGENDECTAVETGSFAPLPMNTEWVALPEAKNKRPVLCAFTHGGDGNAAFLKDVVPADPDYATARLGDLLAGAQALEVGLEGAPSLLVESASKGLISKGKDAAKFDGLSSYASFNGATDKRLLVREIDTGITLRAAKPVPLPKGGVSTFWLGGDWARRGDAASPQRPRLVICDDLTPGASLLSCSEPIDLELLP